MTDPAGAMLFGALLLHFAGDYALQSAWMATNKVARWWPAAAHGIVYGLPFLLLTRSPAALLTIGASHAVLDHYRAAKYLIAARNLVFAPASARPGWSACLRNQGSTADTPAGLATALLIIVDNTIHVAINSAALLWLR